MESYEDQTSLSLMETGELNRIARQYLRNKEYQFYNPLKEMQISLSIKIRLKTLIKRVDTKVKPSIIRTSSRRAGSS
ncbi:hypothetical protein I3249_11060 [Psychrobacter sp. Ps1]|uniref:hypothetical protein n=1 Tax=Psychrobacter sp. Ps1 TaxID=2790955 RepID=UPI001EDD7B9B|nr:hypothetical protein [Psychrobacter sp. Ps1]MCG3843316.1 hypothetical protein [Psychrobacter sp. Ps1]